MSASIEARRRTAVQRAHQMTVAGRDYQEIQVDLINDTFFTPLFAGLSDDASYSLTMEIINEAEAAVIDAAPDPLLSELRADGA